MTLSITPLTPTIGAVVEGMQISDSLGVQQVADIGAALAEHHVLFFRDHALFGRAVAWCDARLPRAA